MRVLAVCGSGQKKGNVARLIENLTDGAKDGEHDTETIFLSDYNIEPCLGCWGCYRKGKCIIKDDFEVLYEKFEKADYVLLGTPVFYGGVTGMMKNYLDRYFGYAMDKFPGAENYSKMTSFEKVKFAVNFGRGLKGKREIQKKKFIFVVALNKPYILAVLSGDIKNTIYTLSTFVENVQGRVFKKIVLTYAFFSEQNSKTRLMEKAYNIGRRLR